jgi:hypothetical protein
MDVKRQLRASHDITTGTLHGKLGEFRDLSERFGKDKNIFFL